MDGEGIPRCFIDDVGVDENHSVRPAGGCRCHEVARRLLEADVGK